MNQAQTLHNEAMDLAEEAALEQAAGRVSHAKELFAAAFDLERKAADQLDNHLDMEPTRSVLFRSAASLALDCGDPQSAEKLIARGLIGNPPPEIASELRDLYEQVNFNRHLDVRGVILGPQEVQMSITGNSVGLGFVDSDVFISRVQDVKKLVYRTAERRANRPFHERGRRDKHLAKDVAVYLSMPRAASYAVTFRIGYSIQIPLPGMDPVNEVIQDMLDCIKVIGAGQSQEVKQRIPDLAYRRNFLALTKRIAPDGDAVRSIGFTAIINGAEKRVLITRTADEIISTELPQEKIITGEQVEVQGILKYANSMNSSRDEIRIRDTKGRHYNIIVPEGMMDDIVRPLWDCEVLVRGTRKQSLITLQDISRIKGDDDG